MPTDPKAAIRFYYALTQVLLYTISTPFEKYMTRKKSLADHVIGITYSVRPVLLPSRIRLFRFLPNDLLPAFSTIMFTRLLSYCAGAASSASGSPPGSTAGAAVAIPF